MPLRFAVVVFPGTWSDHDTHYALSGVLGQEAELVWHRERDLSRYDVVVLPGGFSYGDYLRAGAIGRFSPVMEAVAAHAEAGKPLIGVCNGFQVLCEAHLLPGALMRNESLQYRCVWVHLRVENAETPSALAHQPRHVLPKRRRVRRSRSWHRGLLSPKRSGVHQTGSTPPARFGTSTLPVVDRRAADTDEARVVLLGQSRPLPLSFH